MRKLKLQVQMTLDGYVAGPNGEMDWMTFNWDEGLKNYVRELSEPVGCIVLGRKLAQGFIPYWASKPEAEEVSGVDKMNNTPKVVFTRTLDMSDWDNTVLAKGEVVDEIMKLKRQTGKDIIVYGGATFVSALFKEKLIDEFHLFINPVVIGSGMTICNGLESIKELTLVKSTTFDCGIVVLLYVPKQN